MRCVRSDRWLPLTTLLVLAGVLTGGPAIASPPDHDLSPPNRPGTADRQDCLLGHISEMWSSFDIYTAQGGYKYFVHPSDSCDCPSGFRLDSIQMGLVFSVDDVPITFEVYADLEEAVWNEGTQCWEPGSELCVSQTYSITIESGGVNYIEIPIYGECECECLNAWYFLSFHFPDPVPEAELLIGDAVDDCVAYQNTGSGWTDWNQTFQYGCFVLFGEAYCCDGPSPVESITWGRLKGRFRM